MEESSALTVEHFKHNERWTAADRLWRLVTSGINQVSFAVTGTGFVLSYPAEKAEAPAAA